MVCIPLKFELSDQCRQCIQNHLKEKKEFKVTCSFIPKEMELENPIFPIDKLIGIDNYSRLSEESKVALQLEKNKLLWAKECLGWTPYNSKRDFYQYYQKEFLLCNAQNRVMRFGRRLGKCISGESVVYTNKGLIKVDDLKQDYELLTFNEKTKETYFANTWYKTDNGIKDCLEIISETGKKDIVTFNHPYYVKINNKYQWVEADKLVVGDVLLSLDDNKKYKSETIKSINYVGKQQTYSILVPETHTFVTDHFITHNTEVMTVDMLHYGSINPGVKILVIAPFQSLIDEIFDRLDTLLSGKNSIFKNKFSRKKQPCEITLENGTKIKGFTTGTDGNSIRGQSTDRVYLDEAAYIPVEAFKAVMAFKLDNPNVSFNAASTPSALETNFKQWNLSDPYWKSFYYPSTILPNFHEKDEPELRNSLTEDGYQLEVEAKFIEGSARVFKSHNIQAAKQKYKYINSREELEDPDDWYITIGKLHCRLYSFVA